MVTIEKKTGYVPVSEPQSSHLWVGNLPFDISESELMALFEKHGTIDGITCYASRSYAFIYYRRLQDAVSAKLDLQSFLLNGNSIKIEFAKPAKPSNHVWVGGFSSRVTKEKLEEELSKFGKIEEFKFIKDRNSALVDFARLEDAAAAVKHSNGLQIGDDYIRVDFLRSHPARREQTDFIEMGNVQLKGMSGFESTWINPNLRNYPEQALSGHKRPQPSHSVGGRKGDNPSKVLWVGYPPSVVMDEEILHNAMILHGEIERIKCYHGRNYSFVEFRSIEEARRAKDALQGRLFNDPRIVIMFSNSSLGPAKDFDPSLPGFRGQRPDMFGNIGPPRPPLMDMLPHMAPNGPFSGTNDRLGRDMLRPFGPRGNSDPLLPTPNFYEHGMLSAMRNLPVKPLVGTSQRKLSPPTAGLRLSPARTGRSGSKTSGWDVLVSNHPTRESKRSRTDGSTYHNSDEYADQPYGSGDIGAAKSHVHGSGIDDYVWCGVIAKGGTPVCNARCIPMGKELEFDLPEVVNCSARTGLDMLAKHYAGAFGFDVVFFLPDSENDFANYTEFLRYLGSKNRAGVAKLDDGTTLFLVPPSDFLTDVLKVTGPERLYGVVLKLQRTQPDVAAPLQQLHQSLPPMPQMERQPVVPAHDYSVLNQEFPVQTEYSPRTTYPTSLVMQAQSNDIVLPASGPTLSLTNELIASLHSIQSAARSSVTGNSQSHVTSSTTSRSSQQFVNRPYPNAPLTNNYHSYPTNPNFSSQQAPALPENLTVQNYAYNLQEQGSVAHRPTLTGPFTSLGQQYVPQTQGTQSYPTEVPHNVQQGYAMMHPTPTGSYNVTESHQPYNPGSYPNQPHEGNNSSRLETNLSGEPSGVVQGTADVEVDKNQRYQSTLQFAASLLLQIQQQQQQKQQQHDNSNIGNWQ